MGWDCSYAWKSKKDVIAEQIRPGRYGEGSKALAHKSTSQALYIAVELPDGRRFLEVSLIESRKEQGTTKYWLKGMSEEMGPYGCEDCPLALLELVPEPASESAKEWRERVRKHHATKAALKVGALAKLVPGVKYRGLPLESATIASVKPLCLALNGTAVKVSKKLIAEVL